MIKSGTRLSILFAVLLLSGCASLAEDMLAAYQCEREAVNRPDETQRKAECQMQAQQVP